MKKIVQLLLLWALFAFGGIAHAADFPGNKVLFESGKAEVPAASGDDLKKIAEFMAANPAAKMQLSGYVDSTGPADVNKELAKKRAMAVRDALKDQQTQSVRASRLACFGIIFFNIIQNQYFL